MQIKFSDIEFVNAAPSNNELTKLGCEGLILYADGFAETHIVLVGFEEDSPGERFNGLSKSVVSTSSRKDVRNIAESLINCSIELRGKRLSFTSIRQWMQKFNYAIGESLDLLSDKHDQTQLTLIDHDLGLHFSLNGSRLAVSLLDAKGEPATFDESTIEEPLDR